VVESAAERTADAWDWRMGILEAVTGSPFFSALTMKSTQMFARCALVTRAVSLRYPKSKT